MTYVIMSPFQKSFFRELFLKELIDILDIIE